jgi:hypothetical protein
LLVVVDERAPKTKNSNSLVKTNRGWAFQAGLSGFWGPEYPVAGLSGGRGPDYPVSAVRRVLPDLAENTAQIPQIRGDFDQKG